MIEESYIVDRWKKCWWGKGLDIKREIDDGKENRSVESWENDKRLFSREIEGFSEKKFL